ncbi:MAG: phosphoribosyl-AMP cyclohydrolase [Arthrobacter sp.]|nr:phosphoribosyl-AMP cyclohydrolase [Arthrobacter sp.]
MRTKPRPVGGTRLELMSEQPAPAPIPNLPAPNSPAPTSAAPRLSAPGPGAIPPGSPLPAGLAEALKRDSAGLVAAIVQQFDTNEVLMLGWMDDEALHRTLTSGRVTFYSRSRQEYWRKGDTSGHVQWVKSLAMDCDGDALLVRVDQVGAACHTGTRTCFDGRGLDAVPGSAD